MFRETEMALEGSACACEMSGVPRGAKEHWGVVHTLKSSEGRWGWDPLVGLEKGPGRPEGWKWEQRCFKEAESV